MRAAIYIRVSTSEQAAEGYSLAAQRKSLMQWCNDRAYDVVDVYADEGISAKDIKHRPAMLWLLSDVQTGKIDVVCVWALSRLTRSVADLYSVWELFAAHNCGLISYTEAFDTTTPTGRAMMGMLGVFAQMEREFTAERVSAAIAERAAQGKRTCNEVLGYDLDGKDSLKINPAEAERVRYIFDRYTEYRNRSAVAELCRLRGYTGKRGKVQTASPFGGCLPARCTPAITAIRASCTRDVTRPSYLSKITIVCSGYYSSEGSESGYCISKSNDKLRWHRDNHGDIYLRHISQCSNTNA